MKIVLAGGSGFLGKALETYFLEQNYEVFILTRTPKATNHIAWNAKSMGTWVDVLENADVLINLTGKSVDCRYTHANKEAIINSRTKSTAILHEAIGQCVKPPKLWLNASSATIYIHAETQLMNETKGILGDDFSMNVCKAWEQAFFAKSYANIRQVALRTSIVLGNSGGAFPKLKMVTSLGLGGRQGVGNQQLSWIHIQDFCKAIQYVIENESITGVVNITAPNPIDNSTLMNTLRKTLKMPFGLPAPRFLLELAAVFLGTETELLLKSRNVYPEKLLEAGFNFRYPTIQIALENLIE
jgi:uncharacterized protein